MSTGTIATQPSSIIDITISCMKARPVWSMLASKLKQLSNPELITSSNLSSSLVLTCLILILAASRAIRLNIDTTIVRSLPINNLGLSGLYEVWIP